MAKFANQKSITIHREDALNSKKQYFAIITENLAAAARNLNPVAFKLYIYLATNKDGYNKDYSPRDFANVYGVSIDSARRVSQELIDAGYLVDTNHNSYDFYETPQSTSHFTAHPVIKRFVDDDGVIFDYTYFQWVAAVKDVFSQSEIDALWERAELVEDK